MAKATDYLNRHVAAELVPAFAGFDLPSERFSFFALTDEKDAEHLERMPVDPGDILIADRGYISTERMAAVIAAAADLIVRSGGA
jgi:hypothetical protein